MATQGYLGWSPSYSWFGTNSYGMLPFFTTKKTRPAIDPGPLQSSWVRFRSLFLKFSVKNTAFENIYSLANPRPAITCFLFCEWQKKLKMKHAESDTYQTCQVLTTGFLHMHESRHMKQTCLVYIIYKSCHIPSYIHMPSPNIHIKTRITM